MKFVRYGLLGHEKPGILDAEGKIRDLSSIINDIDSHFLDQTFAPIMGKDFSQFPIVSANMRLGAPIANPSKLIAIGLNYADHAKEGGRDIPKEPVIFTKSTTAICGAYDDILLPKGSQKTDWEVELAVIIGKTARSVSETEALNYVAGYTICNDVSEREWQFEHGPTFTKGKSFDTFAPLGPWLVTPDEIGDPQNLAMWLEVNHVRRQTGSTAMMIFTIAQLIAYISYCMTLLPGDIIITGTPSGVGFATRPHPIFLKAGDVMTLGVEKLGEQKQQVKSSV